MSATKEEAISIARRLQFTAQGDWLSRYDPKDEEWLPARMHMAFLRMGIVSPEPHPEGGYQLTPLGLKVAEELRPGGDTWLRASAQFHPGDVA